MFASSVRGYLCPGVVPSWSFPQKMPRKKGQNSFGSRQVNSTISRSALRGAWRPPCESLFQLQEIRNG